jgi:DNA gyrase subunit A
VRTPVEEISVLGRNTQGVRLIRLADGERLVGIERIESLEAAEGAGPVDVPPDAVAPGGGEEPGPESPGPTDTTS